MRNVQYKIYSGNMQLSYSMSGLHNLEAPCALASAIRIGQVRSMSIPNICLFLIGQRVSRPFDRPEHLQYVLYANHLQRARAKQN